MTTFTFDELCNELGPEKILHIYDPDSGLKAMVVVDNIACGPAIGGVRMASDVTLDEVFRLARAMTLKNAAAGLPHGGGKSGIVADPKTADKPRLLRVFARAIEHLVGYIPGPDMGTDESCMAWIRDETGRSVGLPRVLGGIPLDVIGATGFGVAQCAEVAAPTCGIDLHGARVAVEGFGNVGQHAARFLEQKGATLVAASDSRGTIYSAGGLPVDELVAVKKQSGSVTTYSSGTVLSKEELITVACDILIPAARPDSIHADNAPKIDAKLIVEGANIPSTPEAEAILHERGVLVMPDFIANAGGVICAAVEYRGGTESEAFREIDEKVRRNTEELLRRLKHSSQRPREEAMGLALDRVNEAMALRARPEGRGRCHD